LLTILTGTGNLHVTFMDIGIWHKVDSK